MARLPGFRRLFRFPWRTSAQIQRDVDAELGFHLELRTQELVDEGMPREVARAEALRRFGDLAGTQEYCCALDGRAEKGARRTILLEELWQDLRFGVRMLVKSPRFTSVALLTVALGIGVNTAMFCIVHGVLVQRLPYPAPEELVRIHTQRGDRGFGQVSEPEFFDLLEGTDSFEVMGLARAIGMNIFEGEGEPEHVTGVRVTAGTFEALGIQPRLGRSLREGESFAGSPPVALLSDGLWRRRFGADPEVVGRSLRVLKDSYEIVGVMPAGFGFLFEDADLWVSFGLDQSNLGHRGAHSSSVIARLDADLTVEQAQSRLDGLSRRLRREHAEYDAVGSGFHFVAQPYLESVVGSVRPALMLFMAAVGLVLLIACPTVPNLIHTPLTGGEREIAVRAPLGAAHGRILRQVLTESLLFCTLGGLGALVVARWTLRGLLLLHPESLPRSREVGLDPTALLFNTFLVVLVALVVGGLPATRIWRTTWSEKLKDGVRQGGVVPRRGSRAVLVVSEVALATVLSIGAGLLIHSLGRLLAVDPGFRSERLLTSRVTLSAERYPDRPARIEFFRRLMADLGAQPLVSSAAAVNLLPMSGRLTDWYLKAEGYDPVDPSVDFIQYRHVTPDYFETLGIPLLRGRAFTRHDDLSAQPVAIVSQSLARRFWGDRDPIGRRVRPGGPDSPDPWHVVVGVVGEVHHSGARQGEVPIWYRSAYQYVWSSMSLVVRSAGDPALVASVVKDAVARVDPHQPVYRTVPMTELEGDSLSRERLCASLLTAFAALALGLCAMGVYSVLAYSVSQRTREIGVRLALGAHSGRVQREVVGEGLRLVLTGIGIGTGAALVLAQSLRSLLFGVTASDPVTFVGVAVVLTGAGLLACLLPARRAARVDVLVALRYE